MPNSGVYMTKADSTAGSRYLEQVPNSPSMYTVKLIDGSTIFINAGSIGRGGNEWVVFMFGEHEVISIPVSSILYILPHGKG